MLQFFSLSWLTKGRVSRLCVHQQPVVTDSLCWCLSAGALQQNCESSHPSCHSIRFIPWLSHGLKDRNQLILVWLTPLQLHSSPLFFPLSVCLPLKICFVLICLFCPDWQRQVRVVQIWSTRRNESPPTLWQTTLLLNIINVVLAVLQPLLF